MNFGELDVVDEARAEHGVKTEFSFEQILRDLPEASFNSIPGVCRGFVSPDSRRT